MKLLNYATILIERKNDMNPKISIIVPVYNVEKYIHKCVDSILNQSFKDFELILIDDGSPDNCGKICDEYASQDSRVIVVHKENGGQATARNAALDIARGEYIGFVDSDDYIESDMYEILYNMCIENDCDISNCSSTIYYKDRKVVNGGHKFMIHDRKEAMKVVTEGVLYDECLWTKLIKKSLLENIRIPTGIAYEDTAFTYKLIDRAEKICCIGKAKYNYVKRENSTMDSAVKNVKIDAVLIYEEMYKFMEKKYPELCVLVAAKLANNSMRVMNLIISQADFNKFKKDYYKVSQILNKYFNKIIRLKEYPRNVKVLLIINKINPLMYRKAIKIIRNRS